MSLYGALYTGISGLSANSSALSATSNNIANVNTVGYKADQAVFSTLLTSGSGADTFSAGGVKAIKLQNVDQQGLIQPSASSTDLAISGNGFFVVSRTSTPGTSQMLYTRAGAFRPDGDGFLRNAAGLYLQGWLLDNQGQIPANRANVGPVNLNDLTGTAQPTDVMNLHANLQSSQPVSTAAATYDATNATLNMGGGVVTPDFERTIQVFDTQGGSQQLRIAFLKDSANTWNYEVIYDGNTSNITTTPAGINPQIAAGTVTFNTDGTLATVNGAASGSFTLSIPFNASSGLSAQNIAVSFGQPGQISGITQFDSPSTIISSGVNGALFGGLTGVRVDDGGRVIAVFDNGVERAVYQLPVATFINPNGLLATSGNAYLQSDDSGEVSLNPAGFGGAGTIAAAALESSTVDLAKEFTDLITTQRAYSASTRIITTSDGMLAELMQIKR